MSYATGTTVSADRSKIEIESILKKYGADQFMSGWAAGQVAMCFRMGQRMIRFNLPMPELQDFKVISVKRRNSVRSFERERSEGAQREAYEHEVRRRWRALGLVIKAKLEAVESKITTFEEEFLAHVVLPGGKTVWEQSRDHIRIAYESGKVSGNVLGFSGDGQ